MDETTGTLAEATSGIADDATIMIGGFGGPARP